MGARGPIKLADKRAEMTRQKKANAVGGRQATPRMPPGLSDEAKREWRRLAGPLFERGLLSDADINTFRLYCETWSRYREAEKVLREQGLTVELPSGNVKQRPEWFVLKDSQQELRALIQLFGLSPTARMRMEIPTESGAGDPMSAILD